MEVYQYEYRLECLRLAHGSGDAATEVVSRARAYIDFVLGSDKPPKGTQIEGCTLRSEDDARNWNARRPSGHAF